MPLRGSEPPPFWRRSVLFAALAVAAVIAWQALTVGANYGGNWTGLFRTGAAMPMPPGWSAGLQRSAHPIGYDGQYYLILAHDPFLRNGAADYLDIPAMRARRILLPLLAWTIAGGRGELVAGAFIGLILAAVFGGVYWLGLLFTRRGWPAWSGLLFLLIPATVIGIDSMTVDVVLAALAAGLLWQAETGQVGARWATLAAAGLVRETGLLLVLAAASGAARERRWGPTALWLSAALPAVLWYLYLDSRLPPAASPRLGLPAWLLHDLQGGLWTALWQPLPYPTLPPTLRLAARALDATALSGMMATLLYGAWCVRRGTPGLGRHLLAVHVVFALALLSPEFWSSAYGFGRAMGPLFTGLLAVQTSRPRLAAAAALLALIDLRILAEYAGQAQGVLRWLGR